MPWFAAPAYFLAIVCIFLTTAFGEPIRIDSKPFTQLRPGSDATLFGRLEFLGGLELTSDHQDFGGLSAIGFTSDKRIVLITDKARVITAELIRETGRPTGIRNAYLTRIKNSNGRTITGANDKDAEALEIAGDTYFVGFERNDRILRFRMNNHTLIADAGYSVDLNKFEFPNNKGPEAIALHPESRKLYAFAEHARDEDGNHRGFAISRGMVERELSVLYTGRYSLTDAAFLPNGDLLLLERYYNPFTRTYMRIRRINNEAITGAIPLDGEILVELDSELQIDNMEGLAASPQADGSYRLTVVSDDNFSDKQRTLLLEFKLN